MKKMLFIALLFAANIANAESKSPSEDDVIHIMKRYSIDTILNSTLSSNGQISYKNCTPEYLEDNFKSTMDRIELASDRQSMRMGATSADFSAGLLAKCALAQINKDKYAIGMPNNTIKEWAYQVGFMLAMSHAANPSKSKAQDALTLAVFSGNKDLVNQLRKK